MAKRNARSPIKADPLRLPGQSLQEERDAIWENKLGSWVLQALMFVVLAALEWWRVWTRMPPAPEVFTAAAAGFVAFAAWRVLRYFPKLKALKQGLEGERAVGQFLERLREDGYTVFHDVMGPTFNIDHIVIGPAGIFTIETKTWSKPVRGDARVTCRANRLLVAGQVPDRDPIVQARAQASWMRQQILESTGKSIPVKPVIVFPGWFIDPSAQRLENMWVLEPKALPGFPRPGGSTCMPADVKMATFHLSRMIRSDQKSRR